MDLRRLLGAHLPNQGFGMPVSVLLHVVHFPNYIFSFQMSKLSVLFNVVESKMLFHYLEYLFSLFTCFFPFAYQRVAVSVLSSYISATISAPLRRFLSFSDSMIPKIKVHQERGKGTRPAHAHTQAAQAVKTACYIFQTQSYVQTFQRHGQNPFSKWLQNKKQCFCVPLL